MVILVRYFFLDLRLLLYGFQSLDSLVVFAFVFICSGLFFKIGLFPFSFLGS
jgi:NADH:ubiquinone oxidoreductase subunit 2 (subunit N)